MSFGDVIQSRSSPSGNPFGIGGDINTIWHCDYSAYRLYEVNTSDLSVIRSVHSTYSNPSGMGGDANTIWLCYLAWTFRLYEVNTSDLSLIRYASSPGGDPHGIGGDANTIWHSDDDAYRLYELNTSDFSVIRIAPSSSGHPYGIGGDANTIWYCDYLINEIRELATSDFSAIRCVGSPSNDGTGIGGDVSTIWHCDTSINKIYELDIGAPPTYTISGNVKDSDGNNLNNVTITLEDGTDYSTNTDASGNYSQVVDPDVYTVTATLSGYLNSSASVDASAGDQIQNFILSKPIISGNVKDSGGNNLNNVTISLDNGISYETTTDGSGNYSKEVDADVYTVTALLAGYLDNSALVNASAGDQTQNFVLSKPVISGNIKDDKGYNIDGAIIVFTDDTSYETTTDSDGNYSQEVDTDKYTVEASLTGYLSDSADVDASSSDQTQDFVLGRTTAPHDKGIYLGNRYLLRDIRS